MQLVMTTTIALKGTPEDLADFLANAEELEMEQDLTAGIDVQDCGCGHDECLAEVVLTTYDADLFDILGLTVIADNCLFGPPEGYEVVQEREDFVIVRPIPVPVAETAEPAPVQEEPELITA